MKVLIVSATTAEIAPLFELTGNLSSNDKSFYSFTFKEHSLDIVITGVGMTATAYHTTKALLSSSYNVAINAGICGSFNKNLEAGTVVNIYHDIFSELGAEEDEHFLTLHELQIKGISEVVNTSDIKNTVINDLPKVNGITVNTVHGNELSIHKVFDRFRPITESMEGAAFMLVCQNEQLPFVQIRSVSNYVERRNKNNWNIPLAIQNLNKKLVEVLTAL